MTFLRYLFLFALLGYLLLAIDGKPPNILVIVSEDNGPEIGC